MGAGSRGKMATALVILVGEFANFRGFLTMVEQKCSVEQKRSSKNNWSSKIGRAKIFGRAKMVEQISSKTLICCNGCYEYAANIAAKTFGLNKFK